MKGTFALGWFLGGTLLFLTGCSTTPVVSHVVFEDMTRLVRVDVTYRTGKEEHSHPATVSSQEIARALQFLTYETSSLLPVSFLQTEAGTSAFSQDERDFLASNAASALSRATPLEEVVFFWVHTRTNEIREVTSGSVYVQGEDLNLILANFKFTTTSPGAIDRARTNPLEVLGQPLYHVEAGETGKLYQASFYETWFSQPQQHFVLPLNTNIPTRTVPDDQSVSRPSKPSTSSESSSSLREKLKELQSLRDEGLISEEEYRNKRHELLDRY